MGLTDTTCRNVQPIERPVKISDGGGLFLLIQPTGSKLWRLAYRFDGKQKTLAFGTYPTVSLKDARAQRDAAKELLAKDIDPGDSRKLERRRAKIQAENTFSVIAREWFEARQAGWTPAYSNPIWRRIEADIFSELGLRPIHNIEPLDLLAAIRKVEDRGAIVLAKRLLQISGQVFRYAIASGRASRDPSQDLRGALKSRPTPKHRTALKGDELPAFMQALDGYNGDLSTVLALRLTMHTFLRTSEIRFGRWSEFESLSGAGSAIWRIPAERMKMRSEHLVPLTDQVLGILKALKRLAGKSDRILPAPTKEGVISQNTLIYALYRMGYHSRATVHGFRRTASTILTRTDSIGTGLSVNLRMRNEARSERHTIRPSGLPTGG